VRVGVAGANGFMGAEAARLLLSHPHFELTLVSAGESAGKKLRDVRPGLDTDLVLQPTDPSLFERHCDAVILALPHGASAPIAEDLIKRGRVVLDLGSDFRIKDPEESFRWYGRHAPRRRLLEEAWYGLPELTGPPPEASRLIANPGCFATALCLGLAPLAGQPLDKVRVSGITGSSGSGVSPAPGVHHSTRATSFVPYKPLEHQHLGEVLQLLKGKGASFEVDFVPHSAPLTRGIFLTLFVDMPADDLYGLYFSAYEGAEMMRVTQGPVPLGAVIGTNRTLIGVSGTQSSSVVFVALDNLLKGGSGQGIQNLNLLFGRPETEGLPLHALWP